MRRIEHDPEHTQEGRQEVEQRQFIHLWNNERKDTEQTGLRSGFTKHTHSWVNADQMFVNMALDVMWWRNGSVGVSAQDEGGFSSRRVSAS